MKFDEKRIKEIAEVYLADARAGDWEHAQRVVKWVKELGQDRKDIELLIVAAYIHDCGWSGLAPNGKIDFETLNFLEEKANANSEPVAREILGKLRMEEKNIKTIIRLITAADKHRSTADDEEVVVDADNLSKLCKEHITEKFRPESYGEAVLMFERELVNRISTEKGKVLYPKLLSELKQEFSK